MELIIVLAIVGWAVSALGKAARGKQAAQTHRPPPPGQVRTPPRAQQARPEARSMLPPREEYCPIEQEMLEQGDGALAEGSATEGQPMRDATHHLGRGLERTPLEREPLFISRTDMEGFDDSRPRPSERAAEEEETKLRTRPVSVPGLRLNFNQESVVQGVIFAEILGRSQKRSALRRTGGNA